ncbi:MAG: SDR family oxidoreductase [Syntrophobacteraceae bacterium]|nr:SDR family oxidoreductase [Syntrophobacteraceae bacterium]
MGKTYERVRKSLATSPRKWLVTGVAGFIGSNLLEALLNLDQHVVGMDNFSKGYRQNLEDVKRAVGPGRWGRFEFIEGDIRRGADCKRACSGVDYVLHQAALGSVPLSIEDPVATNSNNVDGFVQMLYAAKSARVKRFVFASSSSVYGNSEKMPAVEEETGLPLSPYAVSKLTNEIYAGVFSRVYDLSWIALRYFNVFGKRQDPKGAYAAVIPGWIDALINSKTPVINGDGYTSRDFCYIENVVQANILAASSESSDSLNMVYNVACGAQTTLNELLQLIEEALFSFTARDLPGAKRVEPEYGPFRMGDVRHSLADISRARELLGYHPEYDVASGLKESIQWYVQTTRRCEDISGSQVLSQAPSAR